ncbi:hypothetical protein COY23_02720 [bacterium (Candidatus Torokbacteria) CG_4_10_14_0_2_um_filter_35_8]|nr:MAG: hypothetical protein COY23_02720 [bacterium (Candidatus Torokbacteria) CG_4_10_14_0_2_um_filter_35_8]
MNFFQIIKLIEKNGGRYIICEGEDPKYVVMDFKEYEKLLDMLHKSDNMDVSLIEEERSLGLPESYDLFPESNREQVLSEEALPEEEPVF